MNVKGECIHSAKVCSIRISLYLYMNVTVHCIPITNVHNNVSDGPLL